jgi:hypothetical protein
MQKGSWQQILEAQTALGNAASFPPVIVAESAVFSFSPGLAFRHILGAMGVDRARGRRRRPAHCAGSGTRYDHRAADTSSWLRRGVAASFSPTRRAWRS